MSVNIKITLVTILVLSIFFEQSTKASILQDTLIAAPYKDFPVQDFENGDTVLSFDLRKDENVEEVITISSTSRCTEMYVFELEFFNDDASLSQGILCAHSEQIFYNLYNPIEECWLKAQDLKPNYFLLESENRLCRIITAEKKAIIPTAVFTLGLKNWHVFWIGVESVSFDMYYLLVHNEPVTVGLGLSAAGVALAGGIGSTLLLYQYKKSSTAPFQKRTYGNSFDDSQERLSEIWNNRQRDMQQKASLFMNPSRARYFLKQIGLSIEQACERDRFLLTLSTVVNLLLESSAGRAWIIAEHKKIMNDAAHRAKTQQIDGFVYEGGFFKWAWWKLFSKKKQYYTSGYHNRIAEIVQHMEEEDAKKEEEQRVDHEEKDAKEESGQSDEDKRKECKWKDVTKPRSIPNTETDLTKEEFEKTLEEKGWARTVKGGGKVVEYEKNGTRYVTRDEAKSTLGPTADYYKPKSNSADSKIRLQKK